MQNLFRRPSGTYVFRIAVPIQLRAIFGKREVVTTTGSCELSIAKIVAGAQATQWRQRFFDANRLRTLANSFKMDHQDILKLAQGHPVLQSGGHLSLQNASTAAGISTTDLLRAASSGKLSLCVRSTGTAGYLLPISVLELNNPAMGQAGGFIAPSEQQMPSCAEQYLGQGVLTIPAIDLPGITAAFLTGVEKVSLVALELSSHPGMIFIPNDVMCIGLDRLEVVAGEVEVIRRSVKSLITPEQMAVATAHQQAVLQDSNVKAGKRAKERLSTSLDAYITLRVRQDTGLESEITRIRNGCALLIEMEGDLPLAEINADLLRNFRDKKLAYVPANENKIRLIYGSKSVTESIVAVESISWPVMSVSEREKRMRWISSWFRWLHSQKWITEDPAACLRGEYVLTKAERRKLKPARRDDEDRETFTTEDLNTIFSASWFKSGKGEITRNGTYRTYSPLRYWLPLLGLFTGGGRINELCQLHLSDIRQTADGTWFVDMNEDAIDQKLKSTPSRRIVPLHPILLTLGFAKWHAALIEAGYTRLFPELKLDSEKGYGKAATKWFTNYMASLGIPRDGTKTFHSFRHTYINALPADTPERIHKQLAGHTRGQDVHDNRYKKDVFPEVAAQYVNRLAVTLPEIAPFDIESGLKAIADALQRKNKGHGAKEDVGGALTSS